MLDVRAPTKTSVAAPLGVWALLILVAVVWGKVLVATHHRSRPRRATVLESVAVPSERAGGSRAVRRTRGGVRGARGLSITALGSGPRGDAVVASGRLGVRGCAHRQHRRDQRAHRSRPPRAQRLPAVGAWDRISALVPRALRRPHRRVSAEHQGSSTRAWSSSNGCSTSIGLATRRVERGARGRRRGRGRRRRTRRVA